MKASGELLFGIPSGDGSVIHYDYTVILPVIRHTVNALQATMDALGETTSAAAHMYYRVAVLAEVIQSLGSLSADEITAELLLDGLTDDDMDLLDAELAGLKKKRMRTLPDSADSGEPSSPSDSTGSEKTASGE